MRQIFVGACLTMLVACEAPDPYDGEDVTDESEPVKPTVTVRDDHNKSGEVVIDWECNVSSNNAGCAGDVICPDNKFVKAVKAGCNLELNNNPPSWTDVSSLPDNILNVYQVSTNINDGSCWAAGTWLRFNSANIGVSGFDRSIYVGCKEHDNNGGDCLQRGYVTCGW